MGKTSAGKSRYVPAALVGLLVLSFALRYAYWQRYTLVQTTPDWPTDYRGYIQGAHEILNHGWPDPEASPVFRDWPPLFPLYLAVGYRLFGEETHLPFCWLALFCSTAVVLLGYVLARQWGFAPGWALLGAGALAVNPGMLFHAGFVLSDTPFTLLVTLSIILLLGYLKRPGLGRLLAVALVAGASTYLRFAGIVVVGSLAGLLMIRALLRAPQGVRHALIFVALSGALLVPLRAMTGFPRASLVRRGSVTNAVYSHDHPLAFWEVYSSDSGRLTDRIHLYQAVYYTGLFGLAVVGLVGRWGLKELGALGLIAGTFLLCTPWLGGTAPYFRYRMPVEPVVLLFALEGLMVMGRLFGRPSGALKPSVARGENG